MKVDDLTVFFRLIDKSKGAFGKIESRFSKLNKAVAAFSTRAVQFGGLLSGVFIAATARGAELSSQLVDMSLTIGETIPETQALFNAIKDASGVANLDNINEAILTMKERFADARVSGAGPLVGLIEDFGLNLDLNLDSSREQLANFLEEVGKLETANEQIFALKDVLGDDDARAFLRIIQDTEKLNGLLLDLRTNIDEIPNILSDEDVRRITEAKDATNQLRTAWDNFALKTYSLVAPVLEAINKSLTFLLDKVLTPLVSKMTTFFGLISRVWSDDTFQAVDTVTASIDSQTKSVKRLNDETKKSRSPTFDSSKTNFGDARELARPQVANIDLIKRQTEDLITIYDAQIDRRIDEVARANERFASEVKQREAEAFNRNLNAATNAAGAIGSLSSTFDGNSADSFAREISQIESQRDILETKTLELNQARIRNQQMMQQLGVANLRENAFDAELEKIRGQQKQLDAISAKAYAKRKKDFERNKKIQKAVAIVENIAAGVKAYNSGAGGFTGLPALAFSLATGYAQVRKICATKFDGAPPTGSGVGAGGGSSASTGSGAGTTAPAQPAIPQQRAVNITIEGGQGTTYTYDQMRQLVNQLRDSGLNLELT